MRTDIHAPSKINPAEYEYVAVWTMNIQSFGDALFIQRERELVRAHMAQTGGTYASVETSGSCQVCGNVLAIYLALFWHKLSNTYIRVGFDCTRKLELAAPFERFNAFRRNVQDAREFNAGKRKAIALLSDWNLSESWDIYSEPYPKHSSDCSLSFDQEYDARVSCTCGNVESVKAYDQFEERTIRDIVSKLVKYGSISEKQQSFVRSLLHKIAQRPIIEAQRQAEKDAAGPVPTGRVQMSGEVLSLKTVERPTYHYGDSGISTKVLIRLENGSKVYGNRFANVERGQLIQFKATVEPSKTDSKFGFFKRPILISEQENS